MRRARGVLATLLVTILLGFTIGGAIVSVPEYAPALEWSNTYGAIEDWPLTFIELVSDGGYIAGCTSEGTLQHPAPHFFMVKTDAAGRAQWNRTYSGPWQDSIAHAQQTFDAGYIVTGWTTRLVNDSLGNYAWLIKTTDSGLPEWNRTYGSKYGTVSENLALYVEQTADGGYVFAGMSWEPIGYNLWLVKTDSSGNLQWNRTYLSGIAQFVHQVEDGGFVVAGKSGYPGGSSYFLLLKTDSAGNMEWNYTYDQTKDIILSSAAVTSDGGYVMVGSPDWYGENGGSFTVVRTDYNGSLEWQHKYTGDWNQACYGVAQTSDGGYILVGRTSKPNDWNYSPLLIKTDDRGTVQWTKRTWENAGVYPGEYSSATSVVQTSDGGYAIAGSVWTNHVPKNLWIGKLAPTLSFQPVRALVFSLFLVAAIGESLALVVLLHTVDQWHALKLYKDQLTVLCELK